MISPELRFQGFDVTSWTNLLSLFMPGMRQRLTRDPDTTDAPVASPSPPTSGGTLLVVVDEQDTVLSAHHSLRGRVEALCGKEVSPPEVLCERFGALRCLLLREGVMEELAERLALRHQRNDDYISQWLGVLRALRELMDGGLIRLWPNPLSNVPVPSPATVRRALDLALPDGSAAVLVLFEGGRLWTALALRRQGGLIDQVAGPDLITQWTGPLGGDWRRDYRIIADAVSRAVAPVHLGLFSEPATVRQLLLEPRAGAWARESAVRNIILHPLPRTYGLALGADAVRGIGKASARALGGLDIPGTLLPLAQRVRAQLTEATTVSEVLGFDPISLLGAVLRRSDGAELDGEEDSAAE